jgi:hypothetical protein
VFQVSRLLIVRENAWQPDGQMLISTMGSNEQGMTFLVVQDHQSATSQDFSRAPD